MASYHVCVMLRSKGDTKTNLDTMGPSHDYNSLCFRTQLIAVIVKCKQAVIQWRCEQMMSSLHWCGASLLPSRDIARYSKPLESDLGGEGQRSVLFKRSSPLPSACSLLATHHSPTLCTSVSLSGCLLGTDRNI